MRAYMYTIVLLIYIEIKPASESLFSSTATGSNKPTDGNYYSSLLTSMLLHFANNSDIKKIEDTIFKKAVACVVSALNYL